MTQLPGSLEDLEEPPALPPPTGGISGPFRLGPSGLSMGDVPKVDCPGRLLVWARLMSYTFGFSQDPPAQSTEPDLSHIEIPRTIDILKMGLRCMMFAAMLLSLSLGQGLRASWPLSWVYTTLATLMTVVLGFGGDDVVWHMLWVGCVPRGSRPGKIGIPILGCTHDFSYLFGQRWKRDPKISRILPQHGLHIRGLWLCTGSNGHFLWTAEGRAAQSHHWHRHGYGRSYILPAGSLPAPGREDNDYGGPALSLTCGYCLNCVLRLRLQQHVSYLAFKRCPRTGDL